jgi:hypothetical protein
MPALTSKTTPCKMTSVISKIFRNDILTALGPAKRMLVKISTVPNQVRVIAVLRANQRLTGFNLAGCQ